MSKKFLCLLFALFSVCRAFASEIKIAPLAVFDSAGNKTSAPFNPSKAIQNELEKHWFEGLVTFSNVPQGRYGIPVSIMDANKICVEEGADYLIYGYVRKNETNWFCEVKLYGEAEKKIIKEFFASDSTDHYDRLINSLNRNILSGIEELTGVNQDEKKKEKMRAMELNIAPSLFYWTPVDRDWGNKISGIAGINGAVEFYPPQPVMTAEEKLVDFSVRFNLLWDIGINKAGVYPLVLNTVTLGLPALLHVHFDQKHSLYSGAGISYSIELMSIKPKYEDKKLLYQNVFSLEPLVGYEFNLNQKIKLFGEMIFDFHIMGDGFASVKTCLGSSFNIFRE